MFRKYLLATMFATVLTALGVAQNGPKPLTNDDVVAMFKGGLGESTVISAIQSQDTNFDISATGLLQLKKSGVSPKIMDAVINAAGKHKAAEDAAAAAKAAAPPAPITTPQVTAGQPSILIVEGPQKQALPAARTQIVQTKAKVSTLGALASDGSLSQAMSGITQSLASAGMMKGGAKLASTAMMANPMLSGAMMAGNLFASHHKQTVTDVWAIPGQKSETVIHVVQPIFEVHYEGIPGINADEYEPVLLKLEATSSNFRLVGATEARQDALQATTADWGMYSSFVEERVSAQATKVSAGSYQLQAGSALAPGEYGVALRPVNKDKKFAGSSISQNTGDGLVFNSIWSFEVAQ
ncbi:MAG TPA: hypothetical protein VEI01_00495 [Terriglobales bacterium]|nr:hypothetical protein [Terriglobales bacterium]